MTDIPEGMLEGMDEKLAAVTAEAELQRERVIGLARLAAERLRPQNLAQEAGNRMLDLGLDAVDRGKAAAKEHPLRTIGLAAVLGAIVARGPLLRLATSGFHTAKTRWNAFTEGRQKQQKQQKQPEARWKKWIGKE